MHDQAVVQHATSESNGMIVVKTSQFGTLHIHPHHIFHFPQGIIGFEQLTRFVLISDEKTKPIKWLLSVDNPEIGFPVVNAFLIYPDYPLLQKVNSAKNVILIILRLSDESGNITANLRAPIILDIEQQTGKQIVLTSEDYPFEYVVLQS